MWAIRAVGSLLLFSTFVCGLLIWANWHTASLGGHDLKPLAIPATISFVLGVGLLFRRKSAAVIVMLGSVGLAGWLIIGSIVQVPMPWLLLNVFFWNRDSDSGRCNCDELAFFSWMVAAPSNSEPNLTADF